MTLDEKPVSIRPAVPRDAESLADLHLACSSAQPGGFMHRLGRRFFVRYYEILLAESTTVILCADAGKGGIVGLVSATLDAERQLSAIRKERLKLLLAVIPTLIRRPSLIWEIYLRNRSVSGKSRGEGYVVSSGARIAYWGWLPNHRSRGQAALLIKEVLRTLESLGANRVRLEADRLNRKAEVVHRLMGARAVNLFVTRDGRERIVLEYELSPRVGEISRR